jgi:hypothetical protein
MNRAIHKKARIPVEPTSKAAPCEELHGMGTDVPMHFMVLCWNRNGCQLVFRRFVTRDEADAAAEALRRVGCIATVRSNGDFTHFQDEK